VELPIVKQVYVIAHLVTLVQIAAVLKIALNTITVPAKVLAIVMEVALVHRPGMVMQIAVAQLLLVYVQEEHLIVKRVNVIVQLLILAIYANWSIAMTVMAAKMEEHVIHQQVFANAPEITLVPIVHVLVASKFVIRKDQCLQALAPAMEPVPVNRGIMALIVQVSEGYPSWMGV
jgi:hypothetical protein